MAKATKPLSNEELFRVIHNGIERWKKQNSNRDIEQAFDMTQAQILNNLYNIAILESGKVPDEIGDTHLEPDRWSYGLFQINKIHDDYFGAVEDLIKGDDVDQVVAAITVALDRNQNLDASPFFPWTTWREAHPDVKGDDAGTFRYPDGPREPSQSDIAEAQRNWEKGQDTFLTLDIPKGGVYSIYNELWSAADAPENINESGFGSSPMGPEEILESGVAAPMPSATGQGGFIDDDAPVMSPPPVKGGIKSGPVKAGVKAGPVFDDDAPVMPPRPVKAGVKAGPVFDDDAPVMPPRSSVKAGPIDEDLPIETAVDFAPPVKAGPKAGVKSGQINQTGQVGQTPPLDAFASDTGGDVPDVTGSITPPKGAQAPQAPQAPLAPPKPAKPIVAFDGIVFQFDNDGNIIRVKNGGSIEGSLQYRGPNSGINDIYANLMRIGGLDEKVWKPDLRDEQLFDLIASQISIFTTIDRNTGKYPPITFENRSMNPNDFSFSEQVGYLVDPVYDRVKRVEEDYRDADSAYQAGKGPAPTYPASYEKDVKLLELYSRALNANLPAESTLSPTGEFQIITGSVPRTGLTIDYLLDPNNKVHKSVYEKYGELLRSGDYVLDAVGDGSILQITHKSNKEAPAYVINASTGNLATDADLKAAESTPIMMINPDGTGLGKYKQHSPDAFGKIPFTEWQTVQKYNLAEIQNSIQNDLTQAQAQANELYRAANLMRLAKQDDNANILEAFSNEEAARANDLAAINNLQAEQRQTLQNIFTAMQDPADVLAASFALTGEQSPMGQLTMADKVNAFVNRYTGMASLVQERLGRARSYKEMMSELSPAAEMAYQPPEFFEGDRPEYTPSQIAFASFPEPVAPATPSASAPATPATPPTPTEPPALPPDLGAFASSPDEDLPVQLQGFPILGGDRDVITATGPFPDKSIQGSSAMPDTFTPAPAPAPAGTGYTGKNPRIPRNNRGGVNLGNPIIVGDSNDGTENEELVMSLNGSPMVVLPLDQNQQRIMENANRFIPRAQNGFPENPTAVEISERDRVMAEANALAAQGQAARDAWQAEQDKYYADQRANETLEITQGQYAWTDEDDETGEKRRRQQARLRDAATPAFSAPVSNVYSTADYTIGGQSRKPATTVSNATAGIGGSASDLFSVPGFTGNITQPEIQRRSDKLTPPRAAAITSGGLRDARYGGYRPAQGTQFGALGAQYATPTPSYLSALTDNERAFLKSNLATRNIFLADVEKDAKRRFGLTGTSQGSRRFTQ